MEAATRDRLPPRFQWRSHCSTTEVMLCTEHTGRLSLLNLNVFGKVLVERRAGYEVSVLCEDHKDFKKFQVIHQDTKRFQEPGNLFSRTVKVLSLSWLVNLNDRNFVWLIVLRFGFFFQFRPVFPLFSKGHTLPHSQLLPHFSVCSVCKDKNFLKEVVDEIKHVIWSYVVNN